MAGRWSDGVPLMVAPTYGDWQVFRGSLAKAKAENNESELQNLTQQLTNFTYAADTDGSKCPFTCSPIPPKRKGALVRGGVY